MENKFYEQNREAPKDKEADGQKTLEERVAEIKSRIPQEEFDKLSRDDIRLGEGLEIKGESSDRKLFIRVLPEDPEYPIYQEALGKAAKEEMELARALVGTEEKRRWDEANKEITQEIAELRSRDRDPYAPDVLRERIRRMEDMRTILKNYFEQLKKIHEDYALDEVNRRKAEYKYWAGQDKLSRFFRETYQRIEEIEDGKKFSREATHLHAMIFYCLELNDKNAVDILIDKGIGKTYK